MSVGESIGADHVLNEGNETVHVLASRDSGTFALVLAPKLLLLRDGSGAVTPESFDRFLGLVFVIGKIKRHSRLRGRSRGPAVP